MPTPETTPTLGITITTDDTTTFEEWRKSINGDDENSMANIIEEFATETIKTLGDIEETLGDIGEALDTILGV